MGTAQPQAVVSDSHGRENETHPLAAQPPQPSTKRHHNTPRTETRHKTMAEGQLLIFTSSHYTHQRSIGKDPVTSMRVEVIILEVAPPIRRVPANAEARPSRAGVLRQSTSSERRWKGGISLVEGGHIVGGREALPHMVQLLGVTETAPAQDASNTARRDRSVEPTMVGAVRALGAALSSESCVCKPRRELITEK